MSMLSTTTKARVGTRAAREAVKRPKLTGRALRAAKPAIRGSAKGTTRVQRRRARHRAESVVENGRAIGQTLFALGREVTEEAAEAQARRKRTLPRVAAGMAIGAGAMYFLEPGSGADHRRMASRLISGASGDSAQAS